MLASLVGITGKSFGLCHGIDTIFEFKT